MDRRLTATLAAGLALGLVAAGYALTRAEDPPAAAGAPSPPPSPAPPAAPRQGPNVLLIVVDTLRADHLGAWGYARDTSPNLDALAASGVRFAQATSQASWTTPSIGSLMTSRYPATLGISGERSALPEEATTLAEILHAAGWATAAVVSHSFCSSEWNFDQGFDTFDEDHVLGHAGVSSPGVTDRALALIDAHAGESFFLWLHYFDPHFAYLLHEGHDFDPDSTYTGSVRSGSTIRELNQLRPSMDAGDRAQLDRLYDAEIAFTDAQIGRVLDRLVQLGIDDDTVVIFTADHGEEFLDHGLLGHGKTLYQELVHVPAIVRCPGWAPAVVEAPVANVDLLPTTLACLGLPAPDGLVGTALVPGVVPEHPIFSQVSKRRTLASVRQGDHKLIWRPQRKKRPFELYDLSVDPGERDDLAPGGGPHLAALSDLVRRLQAGSEQDALPAAAIEPDAALQQQLRELGYVDE